MASVKLEDAFVLDPVAPHVLAVARLGLDDGSAQRYAFAFTGRPLRLAVEGDGAWRALLMAIADGRTVAAVPALPDVDGYRAGLREAGTPIVVDPVLLRAFEIEKETYEFIYASTYLPSWLWAPSEGMQALLSAPT